jgi:hypothetical protein
VVVRGWFLLNDQHLVVVHRGSCDTETTIESGKPPSPPPPLSLAGIPRHPSQHGGGSCGEGSAARHRREHRP